MKILRKSGNQNLVEVQIVLAVVRYLGQESYSIGKIVILTPYTLPHKRDD